MRRTAVFLLLATLSGCAGKLYSLSQATSAAAPDDAYTCVQDQLKKLGYQRKSYDSQERRFLGQKVDSTGHLADVRFRQRVNRLDTRVRPDASGNSAIEIGVHTYDQFDTQQGLTETEITATTHAKLDAQALIEVCGK